MDIWKKKKFYLEKETMSRSRKWDKFRRWLKKVFTSPITKDVLKTVGKIAIKAVIKKHGGKK
ncbi:MAG: hypothetical protein DRH26_01355 [Deltaproteobacteria bacterium]|nr:MAG: hypothetical protein DRH26_01355 [Deltaproteobacteria bacterium]